MERIQHFLSVYHVLMRFFFLSRICQVIFFTQKDVSMIDKGLVSVGIQLTCRCHKDIV